MLRVLYYVTIIRVFYSIEGSFSYFILYRRHINICELNGLETGGQEREDR